MSPPDDSPRLYGDREVGLILKRATELQDTAPEPSRNRPFPRGSGRDRPRSRDRSRTSSARRCRGGGRGSSLRARDGVPRYISHHLHRAGDPRGDCRRRVRDPRPRDSARGHGWSRCTQPVRPDTDLALEHALEYAIPPTHRVIPRRRDADPHRGATSRIRGRLFGGLVGGGGAGIGIGVGVGVGVDVLGSVLFSVAFPLGVIGGCYLLARSIFGATVSRRQRTLHGLMNGSPRSCRRKSRRSG